MMSGGRARNTAMAAASPRWLSLLASCVGAWLVVLLLTWGLIVPAGTTPSTHRPPLPLPVELDGVNIPPVAAPADTQATPAAPATPTTDGLKTW